ncbi:hypothetical protein KCV06_g113, partial [Aureobasidium melanogenum]
MEMKKTPNSSKKQNPVLVGQRIKRAKVREPKKDNYQNQGVTELPESIGKVDNLLLVICHQYVFSSEFALAHLFTLNIICLFEHYFACLPAVNSAFTTRDILDHIFSADCNDRHGRVIGGQSSFRDIDSGRIMVVKEVVAEIVWSGCAIGDKVRERGLLLAASGFFQGNSPLPLVFILCECEILALNRLMLIEKVTWREGRFRGFQFLLSSLLFQILLIVLLCFGEPSFFETLLEKVEAATGLLFLLFLLSQLAGSLLLMCLSGVLCLFQLSLPLVIKIVTVTTEGIILFFGIGLGLLYFVYARNLDLKGNMRHEQVGARVLCETRHIGLLVEVDVTGRIVAFDVFDLQVFSNPLQDSSSRANKWFGRVVRGGRPFLVVIALLLGLLGWLGRFGIWINQKLSGGQSLIKVIGVIAPASTVRTSMGVVSIEPIRKGNFLVLIVGAGNVRLITSFKRQRAAWIRQRWLGFEVVGRLRRRRRSRYDRYVMLQDCHWHREILSRDEYSESHLQADARRLWRVLVHFDGGSIGKVSALCIKSALSEYEVGRVQLSTREVESALGSGELKVLELLFGGRRELGKARATLIEETSQSSVDLCARLNLVSRKTGWIGGLIMDEIILDRIRKLRHLSAHSRSSTYSKTAEVVPLGRSRRAQSLSADGIRQRSGRVDDAKIASLFLCEGMLREIRLAVNGLLLLKEVRVAVS